MTAGWSTSPATDSHEKRLCALQLCAGSRRAYRSEAFDGPVRPPVGGLVRWSPRQHDCRLGVQPHNPIYGIGVERGVFRRDRAEVSSNGEHFVPDETNPNGFGDLSVVEKRADRLLHVAAQLLPGFSLGDDGLGQAFGNVSAVRLLRHLEHDLGMHARSLPSRSRPC